MNAARLRKLGLFSLLLSTLTVLLLAADARLAQADVEDTSANLARLQIGPTWNRVSARQVYANLSPTLQRIALATASVHQGTGIYLGKINGEHLMATNTHVLLEGSRACQEARAEFTLAGKSFACDHIITFLTDVELAVFALRTNTNDEAFFAQLTPVALETRIATATNTPLATFGFGGFMNPQIDMLFTTGSYCKTFSSTAAPTYMSDPDTENTLPYKVWSFALGCNSSWGDSGSPVINLQSGKVIGLLWTARFPKRQPVRDPQYLDQILARGDGAIWDQLTYASSFLKLNDVLSQRLTRLAPTSEEARLLQWLIDLR